MTNHIIAGGDSPCPPKPPLLCAIVLYYHYEELSHRGELKRRGETPVSGHLVFDHLGEIVHLLQIVAPKRMPRRQEK